MRWSIYGAMVLAFTVLPAFVPTTVSGGGLVIALYEPLLVIAAMFCLVRDRLSGYVWRRIWAFLGLLILGGVVAFAAGVPFQQMISDARGLVAVLLACYIAANVVDTPLAQPCLRLLRWILWWSAGLTMVASVAGLAVSGRVEDASLYLYGSQQATGAIRLITPATHLSLAVLCGCIGLLVTRHATFRQALPYVLPTFVIVFLSFSRNSLVAIAAVLLVALAIYGRSWWGVTVTLGKAAALVGAVGLVLAVANIAFDIPAGPYLQHQVAAYTTRVIDGLSSSAISSDPSVKYRVVENYYLGTAFDSSPLVGHGFGYEYKPPVGTPGWYAHNFYLWLLVKTGVLGLLVFLYAVVTPLAAIRRGPAGAVAFGLGAVGLLAVSFIAPIPLGMNGSVALGAAVGVTAFFRSAQLNLRRELATASRPAIRA